MTDVTHILEGLNEHQREAVVAPPGPLLITAGAGSGKTAALTRRIAWLIEANRVSRHQIIAVTFTNKAAREMKSRVEGLLGTNTAPTHISTFHGFSNRFLRFNNEAAGLPKNFTILDANDQKSLIGRLIRDNQISMNNMNARDAQIFINNQKEKKIRAAHVNQRNFRDEKLGMVYSLYEKECDRQGLVDFTELLLRTVEVMQRNELVRDEMHARFEHVLVDEFQDTNALQIDWLKLFGGHTNYVTAVGDEDQSIYGWRGAVAKNMLDFEKLFPNTKLIRLEQNYRSTQTILSAANAVISRNPDRFEKTLWTERGGGSHIKLYQALDGDEEAHFVAEQIHGLYSKMNIPYSRIAILYRTNAQSRIFERVFASHGIPYRVYGGSPFYLRSEVKDVLAFLRLIVDTDANEAFIRVVNVPPRGIGAAAQSKIIELARITSTSYWDAAKTIIADTAEQRRVREPLKRFIELMEGIRVDCANMTLSDIIALVIKRTQIRDYYVSRDTEIDKARVENLDELINAGADFIRTRQSDDPTAPISDDQSAIPTYLDEVTLDAGDRHDEGEGAVQLMTLHAAKGLEFPAVFLTGLDEMVLPHANSVNSFARTYGEDPIEEERRLCYVGMTRAEDQLYITRAKFRLLQGERAYYKPSRFLKEIPGEFMQFVNREFKQPVADSEEVAPSPEPEHDIDQLIGKTVRHQSFGEGVIISVQVEKSYTLVTVNFKQEGEKLLLLDEAFFEIVDR